MKSQILAGGRGLGTFKSGLKGGVHIVEADKAADIAGTVKNFMSLLFLSTEIWFSVLLSQIWLSCMSGNVKVD